MRIPFVQLCNVQRESCQRAGDNCCDFDTVIYRDSLRELMQTVTVESFTTETWGELAILLMLEKEGRNAEDDQVRSDLDNIQNKNVYYMCSCLSVQVYLTGFLFMKV